MTVPTTNWRSAVWWRWQDNKVDADKRTYLPTNVWPQQATVTPKKFLFLFFLFLFTFFLKLFSFSLQVFFNRLNSYPACRYTTVYIYSNVQWPPGRPTHLPNTRSGRRAETTRRQAKRAYTSRYLSRLPLSPTTLAFPSLAFIVSLLNFSWRWEMAHFYLRLGCLLMLSRVEVTKKYKKKNETMRKQMYKKRQ